MPSAYSPEGYLQKNPLLGSIYASSAANSVLGKVTGQFGKLYEQALQTGALGRSTFVQQFQPAFEQSREDIQPEYTEALFKGQQQQGRANFLTGKVSSWYHQNFPGRSDFQGMLRKRAQKHSKMAEPYFERAEKIGSTLEKKAEPLNQFFGGKYFDAGLSRPVLEPYWYDVRGRDWKKRRIRGGSKIVGETESSNYYPGAPKTGGIL